MAEVNIEIEIEETVQNVVVNNTTPAIDVSIEPGVTQVNIEVLPMVGGGGGGSVNPDDFVMGEVPGGLVNGSNATFTTAYNFVPESVEVFSNGVLQKKTLDYNTSGNNIILLNFSPLSTETILVNYIKL